MDRIYLHTEDGYAEFPTFLSLKPHKDYTEKYLKLRCQRIEIIKKMLNGNSKGVEYYDANILDTLTKRQGAEVAYLRLKSGFALDTINKVRFEKFLNRNAGV